MAVILIDRGAHHHAVDWYQSGPSEPSGNGLTLTADDVVGRPSITIDSVLTEILSRAQRGADVVLVCHAREMGLAIPLIRGGPVRARLEAIGPLASDHEITIDGMTLPGPSAAAIAPILMMTESQVTALRQKMNQVRALGLRHVALRGCNVGSWLHALGTFREFFGCQSLSGPTLRDTYGVIPPRTIADVPRWLGTHSTRWHTFLDGAQGSQVGIATRGGESEEHSYDIELAGQTALALQSWGTRHLGRPVTGSFFYHGMWRTSAAPGSPRILFIGDEAYTELLHVV
jgi:hypothetical protein